MILKANLHVLQTMVYLLFYSEFEKIMEIKYILIICSQNCFFLCETVLKINEMKILNRKLLNPFLFKSSVLLVHLRIQFF